MAHRAQLLWDHPENKKEKNSLSFQTQHSIWVTYVSELLMIMLTRKDGPTDGPPDRRTDGNEQHFYVPLHLSGGGQKLIYSYRKNLTHNHSSNSFFLLKSWLNIFRVTK